MVRFYQSIPLAHFAIALIRILFLLFLLFLCVCWFRLL